MLYLDTVVGHELRLGLNLTDSFNCTLTSLDYSIAIMCQAGIPLSKRM